MNNSVQQGIALMSLEQDKPLTWKHDTDSEKKNPHI